MSSALWALSAGRSRAVRRSASEALTSKELTSSEVIPEPSIFFLASYEVHLNWERHWPPYSEFFDHRFTFAPVPP